MKSKIPSNNSRVYSILVGICEMAVKFSFLKPLRRIFGRYFGNELLIIVSILAGILFIIISPWLPIWALSCIIIIYIYRIFTMAICHIGILLLDIGKSTQGDFQIHSRLRYLFLTVLNFIEIIIFGTLTTIWIQSISGNILIYAENFKSIAQVFHYNFRLAASLGIETTFPINMITYIHSILISSLGLYIIVVVLSIMLVIEPKDEFLPYDIYLARKDYWAWRSRYFEDSEWARDNHLIKNICDRLFKRKYSIKKVVDIGCGVGHLCTALVKRGYNVIGIDKSQAMIDLAKERNGSGIQYLKGDACAIPLPDDTIDAITMRMILHNVFPNWQIALVEAKRILKTKGLLVIVEGFPPSPKCRSFFKDVTSITHPRHFFTERALKQKLSSIGFTVFEEDEVIYKSMSVSKWLYNSEPDIRIRKQIMKMHREMPDSCRKAYNIHLYEDDVFIDIYFRIFVAKISSSP